MTKFGEHGDFRNGLNFSKRDEGPGIPIIKVKDFRDRTYVPKRGLDELDVRSVNIQGSQLLEEGDSIIVRSNGNRTLVGRCLFYDKKTIPITFSGFCIRFRPNKKTIDPQFASYFLKSPICRERISRFVAGTNIQNISQDILSGAPILLPPLSEQRHISNILKSWDDKIELIQKINTKLEKISESIFKSWFVDFDGQKDFVDSELGKIPEGWMVDSALSFFELKYGWHLPKTKRNKGKIPVYGSGGLTGYHDKPLVSGPGVIVGRAGSVGNESVYYSNEDFCPLETTFYVKVKDKVLIRYLYFFLKIQNIDNSGSSVPNFSRRVMHEAKIIFPPIEFIKKFDALVKPIFDLIEYNKIELSNHRRVRDYILPKLITGEIEFDAN